METKIIGFGGKMCSGKDTAVEAIIKAYPWVDVKRYAFADALKCEVYDALLNTEHQFWEFYAQFDSDIDFPLETPMVATDDIEYRLAFINERKTNLRHILQVYGCEYRRAQDPLYWVYQLSKRIHADQPAFALISDMRFLNEFYLVKGSDGLTVNVKRIPHPVSIPVSVPDKFVGSFAHASETALDGAPYDLIIEAASVQELQANAVDLFKMASAPKFAEILETITSQP